MPPASPTTPASTTTPKKSSLARTAASPPLRPKTNVPARLRTRMSVGSKPCGTSISEEHVPSRHAGRHWETPGRRIAGRSASMTELIHGNTALAGLDGIMADLAALYRDIHEHPELS